MLTQELETQTNRLSVAKCREILGKDGELMSDQQIEAFRDAVYTVVENVLDNHLEVSSVFDDHEQKR